MRIAVGMIFAVMLMAVLAGCSGGATQPNPPMADTTVSPTPSTDAMGLMSPFDALAASPDRTSSELLLWRDGHDYEPGLSQLVVDREIGARYFPKWEDGQSGSGDLAFAIYSFNVFGYTSISEVMLEWGDAPEDFGTLWIGLSHWGDNRWDWYPGPTEGTLEFGDTIEYVKQDSGDVFVAVVMLGSVPATLDWLQVSESEPGAIVVTGVTPDPAEGLTGTNVDFDVLYTGINDITTTYAWDFGGGATPNNPTEKSPAVTLGSAGAYDCSVTVDNGWGDASTFHFPMRVLGPITITGITPDPAVGYSGHRRMFKVDINGNHDDTTTYNWDFGGGATPNNPTLPSPIVTLGDPGTYDCSVTIDSDYGEPDSYSFSLSNFENQQGPWPMFGLNPQGSRGSQNVGAQTNNVKWKFRTSELLDESDERFGFGSTVATTDSDGSVYFGSGADLHALNSDGTLKWYGEDCHPRSRPTLAADGTIYVGSSEKKLVAFNADGSLKWTFDTTGSVKSIPAIGVDGTVYFGSMGSEGMFYAVNPDGSLKWSFPSEFSGFESSPAIAPDGTIYAGCWDRKIYAFNPDGSLKWSYTPVSPSHEVRSSPVIGADGTIYIGSPGFSLYAINPDGTLRWEFEADGKVLCVPAIGADGTIYFASDYGTLYAVNPDGTQDWSVYLGGFDHPSSPVLDEDGTIIIPGQSYSHQLFAFNPDGTQKWLWRTDSNMNRMVAIGSDGTLFVSAASRFYALNPDRSLKWKYTGGYMIKSSPVIAADGTIYIGCGNYYFYAINPDGTKKWDFYGVYSSSFCPAIGPDGTVYFGTLWNNESVFYAINPDGTLKWSQIIGDDGRLWRNPIIGADGTIYSRNKWTQYAFNADGSLKWSNEEWYLASIGTDGTFYAFVDGNLKAFDPELSEMWSFTLEAGSTSGGVIGTDGTILVCNAFRLYAINPDGSLKWSSEPLERSLHKLCVSVDGSVYGTGDESYSEAYVYAFNPDGTPKGESWPFQTEGTIYSSPAIGADGTVYVGCEDRKIYAINSDGTEKWSYTMGLTLSGSHVKSSPAIGSDGTVYIGSEDGKLYAFGD